MYVIMFLAMDASFYMNAWSHIGKSKDVFRNF